MVINVPGWVTSDPAKVLIKGKGSLTNEYIARDFVVPVAMEDAAGEACVDSLSPSKTHLL